PRQAFRVRRAAGPAPRPHPSPRAAAPARAPLPRDARARHPRAPGPEGRARGAAHRAREQPARVPGAPRGGGGLPRRHRRARLGRALRRVLERDRRVRQAAAPQARRPRGRVAHPHAAGRGIRARPPPPSAVTLSIRARLTLWYTVVLSVVLL